MTLLLASTNPNKIREIRPLLTDAPVELVTLADLPAIREPEESGESFWQNARIKALAYAHVTGHMTVAEDSGLEIAGLHGAPGVHSARFLGDEVPYTDRFAEIYRRLEGLPEAAWQARFVTAVAVVSGREVVFESEAFVDGAIAAKPAGQHGFGYDPIFYYAPFGKTTGELPLEEKGKVSHRARAFRDLARWLRQRR
jgi:XTP/dITP diphosphohydrolase